MRKSALLFLSVTLMAAIPSMVSAQEVEYPIIVVPTGDDVPPPAVPLAMLDLQPLLRPPKLVHF